jgi:lysophospholipid acyltransferase (LPLAT)-like uncharacterized protein
MRLLSFLIYVIVRTLSATLRVRHVRPEHMDGTPQYIMALWHEQMVALLGTSRWKTPIAVMISRSKDSDFSATVLPRFGISFVRGSSTRGGTSAIRELLREARKGKNMVFTVDGPRGPALVAKEGVVFAAQVSGVPIVPVAFAARRAWRLRSWDRLILPKPFSKAVCVYGEPISVPRQGEGEQWRLQLEQTLKSLTAEAGRLVEQKK